LPKSSCKRCAKITGKIERVCLRGMLGDLRSWRNIRRRRRGKKNKYVPRPMLAQIGNRLLPYATPSSDERIDAAMMFAFDTPTVLSGKSPVSRQFHRSIWVNAAMGNKAKDTALAINKPIQRIVSQASFHPELFSKMLAKIAHAHAMADEAGQFKPLLPPYIIGDAKHLTGFLVGGEPDPVPKFAVVAQSAISTAAALMVAVGAVIILGAIMVHGRASSTVSLDYDLSSEGSQRFEALRDAFNALATCSRVWSIPLERQEADWKKMRGSRRL
jgi:hypothetical protein